MKSERLALVIHICLENMPAPLIPFKGVLLSSVPAPLVKSQSQVLQCLSPVLLLQVREPLSLTNLGSCLQVFPLFPPLQIP